jgi:hypothetical protein
MLRVGEAAFQELVAIDTTTAHRPARLTRPSFVSFVPRFLVPIPRRLA